MSPEKQLKNVFTLVFHLILTGTLLSCTSSDEELDPKFLEPPAPYFLKESIYVNASDTLSHTYFHYNEMGKMEDEYDIYDEMGRIIKSDWPNRGGFLSGSYQYTDDGKLKNIVTSNHPTFTLFIDMEYAVDKLKRINMYSQSLNESEKSLIAQLDISYENDKEIQVSDTSPGGTLKLIYELDGGHNPYPEEYRLSHWWWPYAEMLSLILTNQNVLAETVIRNEEVDTVYNYSYEYNEYGFPVKKEIGDQAIYYKYSREIN